MGLKVENIKYSSANVSWEPPMSPNGPVVKYMVFLSNVTEDAKHSMVCTLCVQREAYWIVLVHKHYILIHIFIFGRLTCCACNKCPHVKCKSSHPYTFPLLQYVLQYCVSPCGTNSSSGMYYQLKNLHPGIEYQVKVEAHSRAPMDVNDTAATATFTTKVSASPIVTSRQAGCFLLLSAASWHEK